MVSVDVVAALRKLEDALAEQEAATAAVRRGVSDLLDELESPPEEEPDDAIPGSEPLPLDYGESAE